MNGRMSARKINGVCGAEAASANVSLKYFYNSEVGITNKDPPLYDVDMTDPR